MSAESGRGGGAGSGQDRGTDDAWSSTLASRRHSGVTQCTPNSLSASHSIAEAAHTAHAAQSHQAKPHACEQARVRPPPSNAAAARTFPDRGPHRRHGVVPAVRGAQLVEPVDEEAGTSKS